MANPVPVTYSSPVQKVGGGREIFPNRLLDLLAATPEGGWVKANTNTFQSIEPKTKTPNYGANFGNGYSVIDAWSSFGWDSKRHRICLFGGGHANTDDSALYIWDGNTGEWGVGYYTPEVLNGDGENTDYMVKGGPLVGPISSHTYSGNNYLPVLDRFYTHGGAAHASGGGFRAYSNGVYRNVAGYLCQLDLAGKGFVGAATGSNWMRAGAVALPGALPWEVLDYLGEGIPFEFTGGISGGSYVRVEDGVDTIYKVGSSTTVKNLYKIRMPSLDISTHTSEKVGRVWSNGVSEDIGCAIDQSSETMILVGATAERFWDLKTQGAFNEFKVMTFVESNTLDQFRADRLFGEIRLCPGAASDPKRAGVFAWVNGGRVYRITAPAGIPTPITEWHITVAADETITRPMTAAELSSDLSGAAVLGKWKYAPDLDCYVGMQHKYNGDVWLWRPPSWTDPRGL